MKHRQWGLVAAGIVCLGLLVGLPDVQGTSPDPFEAAQLERLSRAVPMPDVSLPDLEGKNVSLQSYKGQVVLMNFWTTW
ncbi:MAG: redoxin domain-containing protein [Candidatus Tectomicrobia bacterium]|uniref:Redoxin domain-containing protein n=1 Tax=Tectimicrobiota bacterium TaxID=2528274 RepID=A0A938B2B8_UNCTE|nr:redoxin domain-containing protein [Candidatus Tectomicrobia bacterium]